MSIQSAALFGLVLIITSGTFPGQGKDPCPGKTQYEMNECWGNRYKKADAELNRVYQQLLKKYEGQDRLIQKLKAAEEAWIKFRDAHMDSLYSEENKLLEYGSVYPMCWAIRLTELTRQRTAQLKAMLNPMEGDVCAFSAERSSTRSKGKR